jgi:hypothetical protein
MIIGSHYHPTTYLNMAEQAQIMKGNNDEGHIISTRSRPIAIGRTPADEGEESEASCELLYDYATWRMYTRITRHRQKQSLLSTSLQTPCLPAPGVDEQVVFTNQTTKEETLGAEPNLSSKDYVYDDEVFEMDI